MKHTSVSQVLARASATMVEGDLDVTGALASLLGGAAMALPVDAAAILVDTDSGLQVLAATSHRALDLEIYQAQVQEGPCVDAIRGGNPVEAAGSTLTAGWPTAGTAITRAGYLSVRANPLRWHGQVFGALNLFRAEPTPFAGQEGECQALADACTLVLVAGRLDGQHVADGLSAALEERAVVERAKGALAFTYQLDMEAAYDRLLAFAEEQRISLGHAARHVMQLARERRLR
ncbi:GAF domain-containing protein [Phycicoccus ginsengisoli]